MFRSDARVVAASGGVAVSRRRVDAPHRDATNVCPVFVHGQVAVNDCEPSTVMGTKRGGEIGQPAVKKRLFA